MNNISDSNPFSFLSSGEKNLAVAISTGHVTFEDFDALDLRLRREPHDRIVNTEDGVIFILYSDLEMIESEFESFVGPSMYRLILWAHTNNVRFLELDSGAEIETTLPVYDW